MDAFDAERILQDATADFQKTFDQQHTVTQEAIDLNKALIIQHQVMIAVLNKYQRSPWPWVRWVARTMHEEMIVRIMAAERGELRA